MNTEILLLYCCDLGGTEGYRGNRTPSLDLKQARGKGELSDAADSAGGWGGSLHSVMIMRMMMMLENDPLREARDVKLS